MPHPKGYQLVEDEFTSELLPVYPDLHLASAVLSWLVERLRQEPVLADFPIELELVVAQYGSKYPCLGIHYFDPKPVDVEPLIRSLLAGYRARKPLAEWQPSAEFQQFLRRHQEPLRAFCQPFDEV